MCRHLRNKAATERQGMKIPMKEVAGKVAFITGGSSGIGLGIARAFADAGMKVVIGYRTQEHLEDARKYLKSAGDRIHAINVEVTDRRGMEKAAEETVKVFGKVHVLVNNAGVYFAAPVSRITYDDWDWMIGVNLTGVFNGVHVFLPHIQAHGEGGQIITTSSVYGLFTSSGCGSYSASKFAVVGLMEALRAELVETCIGVSVYCPGVVNSKVADSGRNRPSELAATSVMPDSTQIARDKELRKNPDFAMDPLEAGQLVLRGMRNNDLYILSHPEFEQIIADRNEALMASIPRDLHPTETRMAVGRSALEESLYAGERDRQRCAQAARARVSK